MPRRIGQAWPTLPALDRPQHRAPGGDGVAAARGIVERRAEHREEAVAEELVHDAIMPVDDLDEDGEDRFEPLDDLGRRAARARGGEAADVDEHHADPPHRRSSRPRPSRAS